MADINGHDLTLQKGRIKSIGHEITGRISDDACLQVAMKEEVRIRRVFEKANQLANHADRKTIRDVDVILAYELMEE